MDRKDLERVFTSVLHTDGFKRNGSSWYKQGLGALQVVNLQKSNFGDQYYINVACVPTGMTADGMPFPKEYKCPVRIRLESAYPQKEEMIQEYLYLGSKTLDRAEGERRIRLLVVELIRPFLIRMSDAVLLKSAIEEGMFEYGLITKLAREFLGVQEQ